MQVFFANSQMEDNMCNGHDRRIPLDYKDEDQPEKKSFGGDTNLEQTTENGVRSLIGISRQSY